MTMSDVNNIDRVQPLSNEEKVRLFDKALAVEMAKTSENCTIVSPVVAKNKTKTLSETCRHLFYRILSLRLIV